MKVTAMARRAPPMSGMRQADNTEYLFQLRRIMAVSWPAQTRFSIGILT